MTTAGWFFMGLSWAGILAVFVYTTYRTLTARPGRPQEPDRGPQ
jgi:hypothetical protein